MKNLQFFNASFFAFAILLDFAASSQLDAFLKNIEDARLSLDFPRIRPKRSPSIEELFARFDDDEDQLEDSNLEAGDAWYQSFRAMECLHGGCSKRQLRWKTRKSQPDEDYDYYEDEEPILQDQLESTQNDLSHEANYKLSKMEQDAAERKLPKTAWPIQHLNAKRSVNPMKAVKLKTSLRMLKNGYGPTLPSSFLEADRSKISVDDILADSGHHGSPDPWKDTYESMESRKLLSIETLEDVPVSEDKTKICRSKDCLKHGLDMYQFDNINQNTALDRKFEGLSFDNVEPNRVSKKGTLATIGDSLFQSDAFLKFQNFIQGKQNSESAHRNKTKIELRPTTIRPTTSNPLNLVDKDRDVNIKLHMSVNATVLGNGEIPEQFHKNNTIAFKPKITDSQGMKKISFVDYDSEDLNRNRRGVVFPILTSTSKRKANKEISKSVLEATDNFRLDELITGKLTSQLVHTVFSLVKTSPNLRALWPGLMRNKVSSPKQVQNFYAIRNHDNESEMQRTELMLRQAMETINAIIEQQVRSRSCVPLRADLKAFYNLILETQTQFQERPKRQTSVDISMDDSQVRQKSRIVKKLLKDYEELPREDQDEIANIKDSLLAAAGELKELEEASRKRKRQLITNHLLSQNSSTLLTPEGAAESQLSPQYLKLARTAEMLLHNSIKDSDLTIDFDSI